MRVLFVVETNKGSNIFLNECQVFFMAAFSFYLETVNERRQTFLREPNLKNPLVWVRLLTKTRR